MFCESITQVQPRIDVLRPCFYLRGVNCASAMQHTGTRASSFSSLPRLQIRYERTNRLNWQISTSR